MKNQAWLWDVKRTENEVRQILSTPQSAQFMHYVVRLLSRCNEPKEVFNYVNKENFCKYWQKIKRRMLKDKWNQKRVEFWEEIYKYLVKDIKLRGGKLRTLRTKPQGSSLSQKVGSVIRELRFESGMTQKQLADKAGVKQQVISKIESGNANPSLQTIDKIKKHLKGDIDIVNGLKR